LNEDDTPTPAPPGEGDAENSTAPNAWTAHAARVLAAAPAATGVIIVDDELHPLLLNARCTDLLGAANTDSLASLFGEAGERVAALIRGALSGSPGELELHCANRAPLRVAVRPMGETSLAAIEITHESYEQPPSTATEDHLRHVLDALSVMACVLDETGALVSANRAVLAAAELQPSDVLGAPLSQTYWWSWSAETQTRLTEALDAARIGAAPSPYRERMRIGEGRYLTVMLQLTPLRDGDGTVRNIVVSATDVSELVEMQERQTLLAGELTHRVKNILAIVKALVSRAARRAPTKEALAEALEGRISAMAATISQLSRAQWTGFDLRSILEEQLGPYGAERVTFSGPQLHLAPKAAMALALIAFEMGSNAAKHGALSTPDGKVDVRWAVDGAAFTFNWRELGGPPASKPSETGFGSTLISTLSEGDLGAEMAVSYPSAGLIAELKAPLANLRREEPMQSLNLGESERQRLEARLRRARVLLVEDSPLVALDVIAMLEAFGAIVYGPYTDIDEARAAAERDNFDFALIDIDWDEAGALTVAEAAAGAALVFATGESGDAAKQRFPDAALLPKPYTEFDMVRALASTSLSR